MNRMARSGIFTTNREVRSAPRFRTEPSLPHAHRTFGTGNRTDPQRRYPRSDPGGGAIPPPSRRRADSQALADAGLNAKIPASFTYAMARCVRGHFFVEYVRMIRRRKDVDWERLFPAEDLSYLKQPILPNEWYPMETFERFGAAILTHFEGVTLGAVRSWGKFSATRYSAEHPPSSPRMIRSNR